MSEHTTHKPKRPGCTCAAEGAVEGCYHHDPKFAAKRSRTASRAARSKAGGSAEARAVRELMDKLAEEVRAGELQPAILYAVVAAQNTKLRAIEIERKLEEADVRGEFEELKRELGIA